MTRDQINDALRDIPCTHEALGLLLAKAERIAGGMDDTGQWDGMGKVHEAITDAIVALDDAYAAEVTA